MTAGNNLQFFYKILLHYFHSGDKRLEELFFNAAALNILIARGSVIILTVIFISTVKFKRINNQECLDKGGAVKLEVI